MEGAEERKKKYTTKEGEDKHIIMGNSEIEKFEK